MSNNLKVLVSTAPSHATLSKHLNLSVIELVFRMSLKNSNLMALMYLAKMTFN